MAVSTVALGSNSVRLDVAANDAVSVVFTALMNAAVSHGWAIYDSAYYVIRALNADGVTYKYVQFRSSGSFGFLDVWESWDIATHTGVNLAYNVAATVSDQNKTAFQANYTSAFSIFMFATARWLIVASASSASAGFGWVNRPAMIDNSQIGPHTVFSVYSGAAMCLEYQRENPEDLATPQYPCSIWTHSAYLATDNKITNPKNQGVYDAYASWGDVYGMENRVQYHFGYSPRLKTPNVDAVADSAKLYWASQNLDPQMCRDPNDDFSIVYTNPWNGSNYTFEIGLRSVHGYLGKIYGLKIGQCTGAPLVINATKSLYVDSNFWLSRAGSAQTFIALPTTVTRYGTESNANGGGVISASIYSYYPALYIPF